ncbi:hypothetical protein MRX96_006315 [Rhipicephalus microplus]
METPKNSLVGASSQPILGVAAEHVKSTVVERTSGVSCCVALRGPRTTEGSRCSAELRRLRHTCSARARWPGVVAAAHGHGEEARKEGEGSGSGARGSCVLKYRAHLYRYHLGPRAARGFPSTWSQARVGKKREEGYRKARATVGRSLPPVT